MIFRGEHSSAVVLEKLWETSLGYRFNVLSVGRVFRHGTLVVCVGGEDGVLHVYDVEQQGTRCSLKEWSIMDTKGGPIQSLCLHDVTKLGSVDMIVGDSRGTLTIFSNEQILNRRTLSEGSLCALAIDKDAVGNISIVAGDSEGNIKAVQAYNDLWRIRLLDFIKQPRMELSSSPSVECLCSVNLSYNSGPTVNYILVSDSCCNLHVFQNGTLVHTVQLPSVIKSMCTGFFLHTDTQLRSPVGSPRANSSQVQIALGTQDGGIFIFSQFQIFPYANVELPISKLHCLKGHSSANIDILLCIGHFNALVIFREQFLLLRHVTKEWIHTLATADVDEDGQHEVIIGSVDNSVQILKLREC